MWETLEMITASRMQNIVEIREKNTCFVTKTLFLIFGKSSLGALGVESPHGKAITSEVPDPGCQILATTSQLPDPGYQVLATRSWIPQPGHQILDTRFCQPDPGCQILATSF